MYAIVISFLVVSMLVNNVHGLPEPKPHRPRNSCGSGTRSGCGGEAPNSRPPQDKGTNGGSAAGRSGHSNCTGGGQQCGNDTRDSGSDKNRTEVQVCATCRKNNTTNHCSNGCDNGGGRNAKTESTCGACDGQRGPSQGRGRHHGHAG